MSEEVEDLMGEPKRDPHEALRAAQRPKTRAKKKEGPSLQLLGAREGVTTYWLAQVFNLSAETVRARLADLPPVSIHGKSNRYAVKDAAELLVDPKIDLEAHLKRMRPGDLPANLQKDIWDARLKRQRWEEAAGELWNTSDVLMVLSEVFSIIKSTVMLWPDTVERTEGLSDPQRKLLVELGDSLQDEIYNRLVEMSKQRSTGASITDLTEDDDEPEDLM